MRAAAAITLELLREIAFAVMIVILWAIVLAGCAALPVVKPLPEQQLSEEQQVEARRLMLAEFIVDACTDKATNEERILVVDFILRTCKMPLPACARKACARMQGEACPKRRYGSDL